MERDELVAAVLSGELSILDEAVQAALRRDPELARELEELLCLEDELRLESEIELEEDEPWSGADAAIAAQVRSSMAPTAERVTPRRARLAWITAAAAVVLLGVLLWEPGNQQPVVDPNQTLGPGDLSPSGEVEFQRFLSEGFHWNAGDVAPGVRLLLEVELDGEPFLGPLDVTGRSGLDVPEAMKALTPETMYWEIYIDPVGGGRQTRCDATVTFR
ncbi:MAG: hypothetical protein AAF196_21145 [Planctomycetota bacterium]